MPSFDPTLDEVSQSIKPADLNRVVLDKPFDAVILFRGRRVVDSIWTHAHGDRVAPLDIGEAIAANAAIAGIEMRAAAEGRSVWETMKRLSILPTVKFMLNRL